MSHHVPTAGAILTIIGGVFILLAGVILAVIGSVLAGLIGGFSALLFVGLFIGILTIVMGVLMLAQPEKKTIWGILAIVFAVVSLPTAFGGFIIGFILALIGGILALTYKVVEPTPMMPMGMPYAQPMPPTGMPPPPSGNPLPATCPSCGGANINAATRTCMNCGRVIP